MLLKENNNLLTIKIYSFNNLSSKLWDALVIFGNIKYSNRS